MHEARTGQKKSSVFATLTIKKTPATMASLSNGTGTHSKLFFSPAGNNLSNQRAYDYGGNKKLHELRNVHLVGNDPLHEVV